MVVTSRRNRSRDDASLKEGFTSQVDGRSRAGSLAVRVERYELDVHLFAAGSKRSALVRAVLPSAPPSTIT